VNEAIRLLEVTEQIQGMIELGYQLTVYAGGPIR